VSVLTRTDRERRIDLRCPVGAKALLGKVVENGESAFVTSDNLLELACRDCTRAARRVNPKVMHVVHRFNVLGQLVESIATESD
jgi:hypothetical protein